MNREVLEVLEKDAKATVKQISTMTGLSLKKVRETIEASDFSLGEGPGITLSAGVASFGEDGASPAELVRAADRELYRAKELGRNRVCSTSRSA